MRRRFRYSSSPGDGPHDPWFRLGTVEVTTTTLVTIVSAVFMVLYAIVPAIPLSLAMFPDDVRHGQVWRLLTWPLANFPDFWTVVTIFFFWYFGTQVEEQIGRVRMARFLVALTVLLGLLALLLSAPFGWLSPAMLGLGTIELIVLLVWIAEHPHARFFFNIPAWVLAAVIVVIPVLQLLGARAFLSLLNLLLGLLLGALVARASGLLTEYSAIPNLAVARRTPRRPRRKPSRTSGSVVSGPWAGSSVPIDPARAELDALLDKITEGGMDSLTDAEREHLHVLRRRLRGE